jgi:hypothetical protein
MRFKNAGILYGFFARLTDDDRAWLTGKIVSRYTRNDNTVYEARGCSQMVIHRYDDGGIFDPRAGRWMIPLQNDLGDSGEFWGYACCGLKSSQEYRAYTDDDDDTVFGNVIKLLSTTPKSIADVIWMIEHDLNLPEHRTMICYDKLLEEDADVDHEDMIRYRKHQPKTNDCDRVTRHVDTHLPSEITQWFEISRTESVKTSTRFCQKFPYEFTGQDTEMTVRVRWTDMKGRYFAVATKGDDGFVATFEDVFLRTYKIISCIDGHPCISYPGYLFTLGGGETNCPRDVYLGRVIPQQKVNKSDRKRPREEYDMTAPRPEPAPGLLMERIREWIDAVIARVEDDDSSSSSERKINNPVVC